RRLQEVADREEEGNVSRLVAKILTLYFNNRECADVAMIDYEKLVATLVNSAEFRDLMAAIVRENARKEAESATKEFIAERFKD
ncbi:MAG: hypothetical protein WC683_07625, partial [bacterium]